MKKKTSKQNIAIIVLSFLLLISIGFGATYSYFNGRSEDLTNNGSVTMATLEVKLNYDEDKQSTTPFGLHTSGGEVVPGQPLSNTALQISNLSPVDVYTIVVYSLQIIENEQPVDAPSEMEPMDLQSSSVGSGWRKASYTKKDTVGKVHALVYLGDKDLSGNSTTAGEGYGVFPKATTKPAKSLVLDPSCLQVPESWDNKMQGKTVTLSFVAYIIQAEAVVSQYPDIENADVETRTAAILEMFVSEFSELDTTSAPTTPIE